MKDLYHQKLMTIFNLYYQNFSVTLGKDIIHNIAF